MMVQGPSSMEIFSSSESLFRERTGSFGEFVWGASFEGGGFHHIEEQVDVIFVACLRGIRCSSCDLFWKTFLQRFHVEKMKLEDVVFQNL